MRQGCFTRTSWVFMTAVNSMDGYGFPWTTSRAPTPPGHARPVSRWYAPDDALSIVTAVAGALDYAHQRGLLHRDVKPANILLTEPDDQGERRILLSDFGIARPLADISGLTATNITLGTVAYAPPEQLQGADLDGRADQYALAATAFHLLTGAPPYRGTNPVAVISQHLTATPPKLSDYRRDLAILDEAMSTALAKDPDERFPRCRDFAKALTEPLAGASMSDRKAAEETTVASPTTPEPTRGRKPLWARPPLVLAAVMALLFIGTLIFVGIQLSRPRQTPTPPPAASVTPTLAPPPISTAQSPPHPHLQRSKPRYRRRQPQPPRPQHRLRRSPRPGRQWAFHAAAVIMANSRTTPTQARKSSVTQPLLVTANGNLPLLM